MCVAHTQRRVFLKFLPRTSFASISAGHQVRAACTFVAEAELLHLSFQVSSPLSLSGGAMLCEMQAQSQLPGQKQLWQAHAQTALRCRYFEIAASSA